MRYLLGALLVARSFPDRWRGEVMAYLIMIIMRGNGRAEQRGRGDLASILQDLKRTYKFLDSGERGDPAVVRVVPLEREISNTPHKGSQLADRASARPDGGVEWSETAVKQTMVPLT